MENTKSRSRNETAESNQTFNRKNSSGFLKINRRSAQMYNRDPRQYNYYIVSRILNHEEIELEEMVNVYSYDCVLLAVKDVLVEFFFDYKV